MRKIFVYARGSNLIKPFTSWPCMRKRSGRARRIIMDWLMPKQKCRRSSPHGKPNGRWTSPNPSSTASPQSTPGYSSTSHGKNQKTSPITTSSWTSSSPDLELNMKIKPTSSLSCRSMIGKFNTCLQISIMFAAKPQSKAFSWWLRIWQMNRSTKY